MIDDLRFQRFAKERYGLDLANPYTDISKLGEVVANYNLMPQDWEPIRDNT